MTLMLKKDDRVRLKTGGPVLFVEGVHSNRRLLCSWMDGMGQRHEAPFLQEDLEKIGPFSLEEFGEQDEGGRGEEDGSPGGDSGGDGSPNLLSSVAAQQHGRAPPLGHTLHMVVTAMGAAIFGRRQRALQAR